MAKKSFVSISAMLLALIMCIQPLCLFASAEGSETLAYHVDSLNGTRWADYICVYRDVAHTGQNEWGENIVVNSDGIVTEKIPGGDSKGENLPVPEGGMVVSGTGDIGKEMYASVQIGDKVVFDEYGMRVLISAGEIDPFYEFEITVTGFNKTRNSNTVIIYDKSGERTGTNGYGYEAMVNGEGHIIASGGNDNVVPEGGYVVSVIENEDISNLELYFVVGAYCELVGNTVKVIYSETELKQTALGELNLLKANFEEAKKQYRLIDYSAVETAINAIVIDDIDTLEERNEVIAEIEKIKTMLVEKRSVETRSVWYTPTETTASKIKTVVAEMKAAGINELVLSDAGKRGSFAPIPTDIPFNKEPISRRLDIIQTYIDECRANDISVVLIIPVMGNHLAENKTEWLDVTNVESETTEVFYSPANAEYRAAFMDYLRYLLNRYDVDGLQLDYIRYPEFNGTVDSGYDAATIALFEEKTGYGADVVAEIGKQLQKHPQWALWNNFKVELINSWVEECYKIANEIRPDIYVSAAVAANHGAETYHQDPAAWIKGGYIDGIYPMTYTEGPNETTVTRFTSIMDDKTYLVMGCGAYQSISNSDVVEQTCASTLYGGDGVGYFEWSAVASHGYTKLLANSLFAESAIPFTGDRTEVAKKLLGTAEKRFELYTGENADAIKALLPAEGTDKNAVKTAVSDIRALLSAEDAKWLLCDLDALLRLLNMDVDQSFEFVPVSDDETTDNSSDDTTDSSEIPETSGTLSAPDAEEGSSTVIIIIIVVIIIVAAVVAAVIIKRKKN